MRVTVHGIASCGTVKKAKAWLDGQGISYQWVDLRQTPPARQQIERWLGFFGSKPLRNTSGGSYRALGAEKKAWDDTRWLDAFAADAMLLKRPIVEVDGEPTLVGFKEADYQARFL